MKVLKVFVALILSIIMIAATILTLGSFATERASSEESIRNAIDETNIIDTLMVEVLRENTVNMGGVYGSAAKAIMETDPMKDFIAEYMTSAIASELYGRQREEIANDELMNAFAAGVEAAAEEKGFRLTPTENEMIRQSMMQTIPALTAELNEALDRYETTAINEEMQARIDDIRIIVSPPFRYGSMAIALLMTILLYMLFRRSRLGLLWAAVNVFLATCAYAVAALVSNGFGYQEGFVEPALRMLYLMCEYGSKYISIVGAIIGVALIILCIILRALRRKDYEF